MSGKGSAPDTNGSATTATPAAAAAGGSSDKCEKKEVEGNTVRISISKNLRFYGEISLKMMIKNPTIELHGLGAAVAPTIDVAEHLVHLKKATITKIVTSSVASSAGAGGRKPEIVIFLARTGIPTLPELTEEQKQLIEMVEGDHDH